MMPKEPERMIGALLRIPFEATVARIAADYTTAGFADLRPPHFTIFQRLPLAGARATDIAEQAQLTKQYVGTLITYLEERGYVTRVPDPADGRASLIQFTERGRAAGEVARASLARLEVEWADLLGADDLDQLRALLRRLVALVEGERHQ